MIFSYEKFSTIYKKDIDLKKSFYDLEIEVDPKNDNIIYIGDLVQKTEPEMLRTPTLIFTRSLMINKFFLPNNLIYPKSRILMENYFN